MKQQIIDIVKPLLDEGKIEGFIGLRQTGDQIEPHVFTASGELDQLSLGDLHKPGDSRYPLVKMLTSLHRRFPSAVYAVLMRGCDERAFHKLVQSSQIAHTKVIVVGFPCPAGLAEDCECLKPYPDEMAVGQIPAEASSGSLIASTSHNLMRDVQFIKDEMERCLRCYGCRNICPVCFCRECTLEEDCFIAKGPLPESNADFLFTRAVHMADYCVYCGLCEQACPAHIPLKTIYKVVGNLISDQFGPRMSAFKPRGAEQTPRDAAV